jgi:hypothetical protein
MMLKQLEKLRRLCHEQQRTMVVKEEALENEFVNYEVPGSKE